MCVAVVIGDDPLVELDEFFLIYAHSTNPDVNIPLISATVIILDNDGKHYNCYSNYFTLRALLFSVINTARNCS